MRKLQKRFSSLALILIASMVLNPLTVMAKSNVNPASITKQKLVYDGTSTQVKNLVLYQGNSDGLFDSVDVKADAMLSNSLSTDYLFVEAASSNSVEVVKKDADNNIFTLKPKKDALTAGKKWENIDFIFTVKNVLDKGSGVSSNKNGGTIKPFNPKSAKKVRLKVKVVKGSVSLNLGAALVPAAGYTLSKDAISASKNGTWAVPELGDKPVAEFDVDTIDAKKGAKQVYTVPVTISLNGADMKKVAYTTSNKKVATLSGKNGLVTIKINRNAFTDESGIAEVRLGIGEKGTETTIGKEKVYANSRYIVLKIKPDAKAKKIASAAATVDGKKTAKTALVIGAGEQSVSVNLGATYSSNIRSGVKVKWAEKEDEKYSVVPDEKNNTAVLTVKRPISAKDKVELVGTVEAEGSRPKQIKVKVTAKKLVDEVGDFTGKFDSQGTTKNPSTYLGTNMRQMMINGQPEYVRTFYYANTKKAFKDTFTITVPKPEGYEGKYELANPKLKAVKDVSDSEKNNKSTIAVKQKGKDKYSDVVTLNVKPRPKKAAGTSQKQEMAIYQIVAADSYDKTTRRYNVGNYMAVALADETKEGMTGKVKGHIEIGTSSSNAILTNGESAEIELKLDKDSEAYADYVTITSSDESIVVVKLGDGKYRVYGIKQGSAVVTASVAGTPLNSINVYVVDLPAAEAKTVYPGDKDVEVVTVSPLNGYVTLEQDGQIVGNEDEYVTVTISPNSLKVSQNAVAMTLSANKAKNVSGNTWEDAKVTIPVKATFEIGEMKKVLKASYEFTVKPFEVKLEGAPASMVTGNGWVDLKPFIKITPERSLDTVSVNYRTNRKNIHEPIVVSGTSISPNSVGGVTVWAVYTDVNGLQYDSVPISIQVEDEGKRAEYENQTVLYFTDSKDVTATSNVTVSSNGAPASMYNAYKRFMSNLDEIAKENKNEEFEFSLTIEGTTTNEVVQNAVGTEEASGVVEPVVEAEEAAAQDAAEAAVVETEAAAEAAAAEGVVEAMAEALAEEPAAAEAVVEALEEEPVAEELPEAAGSAVEAEETEDAAGELKTLSVNKTYGIKVNKGKVERVDKFTDQEVEEFIKGNFSDDTKVSLTVSFNTTKTVSELLRIAGTVYDKKVQKFNKTFTITFAEGDPLVLSNLEFAEGIYKVDENDTRYAYKLFDDGDEIVVIYEGQYDGTTTNQNPVIDKLVKVKNLVREITCYNEDGIGTKVFPKDEPKT